MPEAGAESYQQPGALTCPVLVGRAHELAQLARLLTDTKRGRGALVLVAGEAGAGKSRLLRELLPEAKNQGFEILVGHCFERDADFPFAPFIDAFRQLLSERANEDPRTIFGPEARVLVELLPELGRPFGTSGEGGSLPPEQEKRRWFEALGSLFIRLSIRQPVLLILEDLHWADATSLELLELLSRRLASARVLTLGTRRTDEPCPSLERCLLTLRRERLVRHELLLPLLSKDDVDQMLQALLPTFPSPVAGAIVHSRTGGNPFFVEELVATAQLGGRQAGWLASIEDPAIPNTVTQAVLRRLDGLGGSAERVVNMAAVIGSRVDIDILTEVSGLPEAEVLDALDKLNERHILVEQQPRGRTRRELRFRHDLTREAIRDRLLLPRRRSMHGIVADALERAGPIGDAASVSDLSYHFHAAQRWQKALQYASRAGDAARSVHATMEALIHYRRALEAARVLDAPAAASLDWRVGQCLALLGPFEPAREHLEGALDAARAQADSELEQAVLYDLAGLYASHDYRRAEQLAREALALARDGANPRGEALALNRLGNVLTNLKQFERGRSLHEDALQRFEAQGDRWGMADCLDLIGMARYLAGEVPEARAAFERAASIFSELEDRERVASALSSRGLYLAVLDGPCASDASPASFRADAELGLRTCREIGWRAGEAYGLVAVASAQIGEGNYAQADETAQRALAIAEEIDHQQWTVIALLTLGLLGSEILNDESALVHFERALSMAQTVGAAQWVERLEAWVAHCRSRLGDVGAATASLRTLLPLSPHPTTIGQRRALIALAELELAQGNGEQALTLLGRLLLGSAGPQPAVAVLLRGQALAALLRTAEADTTLLEARRLAVEFGPRSTLWRIAQARSRLWQDQDRSLAEQEQGLARSEVAAVAEAIGDERLRSEFLRSPAVRPLIGSGRPRTARVASRPGGLTRREGEVVAWVAQGLSNKEIARGLSIAEKTVEMHVGSCLAKLGFTSRAQLAAWAVAQNLAPAPQPYQS